MPLVGMAVAMGALGDTGGGDGCLWWEWQWRWVTLVGLVVAVGAFGGIGGGSATLSGLLSGNNNVDPHTKTHIYM